MEANEAKRPKRPRIGQNPAAEAGASEQHYERKPYNANAEGHTAAPDGETREGGFNAERPYRRPNTQGGYQQRNNNGGYQPRYNNGGYNNRYNNNGGYNNRYNNGGYNNRPNQGGYQPRYNQAPQTPAADGAEQTATPAAEGFTPGTEQSQQGGYKPRQNNYNRQPGGYQPRQQGGYNRQQGGYNRPNQGGYNRQPGGYNNRPNQGGYNRPNQGGYNNRPNQGGYNNQGNGYNRPNQGGYNNRPNNRYNNNGGGYNNRQQGNRPNNRYNQNGPVRQGKSFTPRPKRIEYELPLPDPNEQIRLNKFMANAGLCSRREADEFIQQGLVKVNGNVVTELGTKIGHSDTVEYNEKIVALESKCYILLNKPKDCVTTSDDPNGRTTVMDLVKGACTERIYPVGRLDRNTTGVLLLTNDGDLASKLTHPKYVKKKIYHVWTDKDIAEEDMQRIADGIELEDGPIHADAISYATENDRNQAGIEIHSGRNRIVRRIFESLGYHVTKLDRVYFAGLTKKNLPRGRWRYLTQEEVNFLKMGSFE